MYVCSRTQLHIIIARRQQVVPDGRCQCVHVTVYVEQARNTPDYRPMWKTMCRLGGGAVVLWVVLIAWKCTFWQCPNISVSIETIAGLYARRLPTFEHAKPRLKPNQNVYTAHSIYTVFRCHVARRRWFVSFARQTVGRRKIAQLFDVECLCLRQTVKVAVCMASGSENMSKSERENETLQHRQICVLI